ncbi:MAG: hypothetical protein ABI878_06805 [Acidobacteriota bacterium]
MKIKIMLFFVVIVFVGALFVGSRHSSANLYFNADSLAAAPQIPDYVLYESMFRLDISFRKKAEIQRLMGQPVTPLEHYFKNKAGLSDAEDEILRQTSLEYFTEMQPINDQATLILSDLRTQFPDGVVPDGQQVQQPPEALAALQEQRDAIALSNRDKLSKTFDGRSFENFDSFVKNAKEGFAANFQALGTPGK